MFVKNGTPQPIKIASVMCESCGQKIATTCVNGKMICDECREKMNSENKS